MACAQFTEVNGNWALMNPILAGKISKQKTSNAMTLASNARMGTGVPRMMLSSLHRMLLWKGC